MNSNLHARAPLRSRWELLSLAFAIVIYLLIRLRSTMEPCDDAYMTLRFVTNLLAGEGYVYNPGEPVLGTTALYPLLLALVCWVTHADPLVAGRYFLLPFEVGNLGLVWMFGRTATGSALAATIATLLFATSPYLLFSTLTYMEAPLFAFLILASCGAAMRGSSSRWRAGSWILAGLAVICRPEGVILFPALGLGYLALLGRPRAADFLWASSILVPWALWTTWEFGGPLPTSMIAKRLAYLPYPNQSLNWLMRQIGSAFDVTLNYDAIGRFRIALNLGLLVFGFLTIARTAPKLLPLLLYASAFWLLYAVANPFIFPWYIVPLDAPIYLAITFTVWHLVQRFADIIHRNQPWTRNALLLLAFAPTLGARAIEMQGKVCNPLSTPSECHKTTLTFPLPDINPRSGLNFEREGWYRGLAHDLQSRVDSSTRILTSEFGVIGYYLPSHMISSLGHVNPEVLPYLPAPREETDYPRVNHAISVTLVQKLLPDYVISPEVFISRSLLQSEWFAQHYTAEKIYSFGVYNYGQLYVFVRNDFDAARRSR